MAMGPKPRDYSQRTPKKMKRLALRSALSDRAADGKVMVVDGWSFAAPKTKDAAAALSALGLEGNVLVVVDADDQNAWMSFRNICRRPRREPRRAQHVRRLGQRRGGLHQRQPAHRSRRQPKRASRRRKHRSRLQRFGVRRGSVAKHGAEAIRGPTRKRRRSIERLIAIRSDAEASANRQIWPGSARRSMVARLRQRSM